jgi:quercetin dioxygenase-like cupin family protein
VFAPHVHERRKLLTCRDGSIRFTLHPSGEPVDLGPGDWLDLPAGQEHSAVAGPSGVRCSEAFQAEQSRGIAAVTCGSRG